MATLYLTGPTFRQAEMYGLIQQLRRSGHQVLVLETVREEPTLDFSEIERQLEWTSRKRKSPNPASKEERWRRSR